MNGITYPTTNSAIATPEQLAIEDVKRLANIVLGLRDQVFKNDLDYGVIPGTGTKPVLLLPGMEKLMRALHLRAEYHALSQVEDFDKGRIYYRYECRLMDYDTGSCVATAIGSANSYESKWRWRDQKRTCPKCGKETINRSKFPPKGAPQGTDPGWYCYAKAGGCGAEFAANDTTITGQSIGRIENPDIFDQMNTIDKIAQKRSLASAIKGAANVSEFYTVDLEDFQQYDVSNVVQGSVVEVKHAETERFPQLKDFTEYIPKAPAPSLVTTPIVTTSVPDGLPEELLISASWMEVPGAWGIFLKSANEKLTLTAKSVEAALEEFAGMKIADWTISRNWALAACVAYSKDYNREAISNYTLAMIGGDKLNEMAQQIARRFAEGQVS